MGKKTGAAGGGLVTTAIMLFILGSWGHNAGVLAQAESLHDRLDGVSVESIKLPKIPGIPTTLPQLPSLPSAPKAPSTTTTPKPSAAQVAAAKRDLAALPVATRVKQSGYTRTQFGQAWTDNSGARLGHNGCDTRNDVLKEQLTKTTFKPGTRNCVVMSGVLADPYTGKTITFEKANASAVQIDHVFPLSAAFDLGAKDWTPEKRVKFANDPDLNLMAADGRTNGAKGDKTPGVWMPPNKAFHCGYAVKFTTVAKAYGLKLDRADKPALAAALNTCD